MPVEVILPKVDMDMTHGTLATWHVAEGEMVKQGAPLFDIETDKAAMEVEAPATGHLHHISAKPGDVVPVGTTIGWIYLAGEQVGDAPNAAPVPLHTPPALDVPAQHASPRAADLPQSDTVRATPAARMAARQAGLRLADIAGSGPQGRIQKIDVAQALTRLAPPTDRLADLSLDQHSAPTHWTPQPGPLSVTRRQGTGTPLVMFHGFTADSTSWAPLEKALGQGCALIRIDLPGHGKSPRRDLRSFADLARAVVEAFDEATQDVDQVHLLGHSVGGALAIAVADIRPRRLASLSLLAPAGLGPEVDAASLNGIVRARRTESLAPWLRRLTASPDAISDDYARAAMKGREDPALRACQAAMADVIFPDGVQAFDLRPALQRVEVPTQILWGRQDRIMPFAQALAVPGDFAMHFLSGVGHIPQIECPDRVARIIGRMISAVGAPA